ncbi:2'-5' RNA ligase family protein [Fulvivirga sediminis]|uniref:Mutarotase n=1 Tax=Fulvivirga sediminis TaxID=2803949 RepID=A0A937K2Q1_9BACT|nr:mutarotase [Fulvivirga sediminis]MBL3658841.1 mutarotase [Fulvivirga sediminis]
MYNPSLKQHYQDLYHSSINQIKSEGCSVDHVINDPNDDRNGITLLARPSETVKTNVQQFLESLKAIEPEQYYYPNSDLHMTIMSIISCYSGFSMEQINTHDYIDLIKTAIRSLPSFKIYFKGISASPSSIIICGYPENDALHQMRGNLRAHFRNSELEQSIDKRYTLKTAHATVVRFQKPLVDQQTYLNMLDEFTTHDFGSFTVNEIELVFNDWYQKTDKVQQLATFNL